MPCDFSGWATRNDLRCADGRVIRRDAFKVQDGQKVPLVWNHQHNDVAKVLGHAILMNKKEGVYTECYFNNSRSAKDAKEAVIHGDVTALSIWANNLEQVGNDVIHGTIREVSLVLAGANPGAYIESVVAHGEPMDDGDEEGIFYTNDNIFLSHSIDDSDDEEEEEEDEDMANKTVAEVFDELTDEQKQAVAIIVGQAIEDAQNEDDEEEEEDDEDMKHNIFDSEENTGGYGILSHSDMDAIFQNARQIGSFREAMHNFEDENDVLIHAVPTDGMTGPSSSTSSQNYGIRDMDMLFPEYHNLNQTPTFISREMGWVSKVMSRVHRTPFARIKSMFADITEDEARARGYIKGNLKKEEVFTLLKRTTDPQTIYKRQKFDRDDLIDATIDTISWVRAEMKTMLDEEIARAILIGDGRATDSNDHIKHDKIRPIITEPAIFNTVVKVSVPYDATEEVVAKETIKAVIRARKYYKGTGSPDFWSFEDTITEMLLLEDGIGHKLYKTETELATALRVKELIPVEPMTGQKLTIDSKEYPLIGIICNLADYNVGTDRGGEVKWYDDFDIDYNQQKYLVETRMSGALIRPFSAITVVLDRAAKPTTGGNS